MTLPPLQEEPFVLQAPPSWRCIDFISDLHLQPELPRTAAAFKTYLRDTPADALLILGDLFEAWVGDDARDQPFEADCVQAIAAASKRMAVAIMVGNRDFLLGPDMLMACGASLLPDPCVLQAWGQRAVLMHGDALCLADAPYLRFRKQVRHPAWQATFLAQTLEARLAQARQMREASHAHQREQGMAEWADVDATQAGQLLHNAQAQWLIHGHTHRPASEPFGAPGCTRHVLSDWDLDNTAAPRAEVLRWRAEQGFTRHAVTPL